MSSVIPVSAALRRGMGLEGEQPISARASSLNQARPTEKARDLAIPSLQCSK